MYTRPIFATLLTFFAGVSETNFDQARPAFPGTVSGRLTVAERGNRSSRDVGNAILWLEGENAAELARDSVEIITANKQFVPRVTVVPVGAVVSFPNSDPFNHNVFSRTSGGQFDLGLYSRGTARSASFSRAGIIRLYCNVHPRMSGFVLVRDNPHYVQPGNDGSFSIEGVPPGNYVLHAWHERAAEEVAIAIEVTESGVAGLDIELDARRYRFVQHVNKFGRPYSRGGRRY